MRHGTNPLRGKRLPNRHGTVISAIVHLPDLRQDYHKYRFDVIKLCLESMRQHAGNKCEVLVWDNGSCREVTRWLATQYDPDFLVLSKNIGKVSARTAILRMFHPDTLVGISDDDMFFYPDWLRKSAEVMHTYPMVGTVSGYPVRTNFNWGCENTIRWALKHKKGVVVKRGGFIPEQWDRDFCTSIGREYEFQLDFAKAVIESKATYKGVSVYLTGGHCQFICYPGRILPFAVWDNDPMAPEKVFDSSIDNDGLLRLTTVDRVSRHMGNVLDDSIRKDAERYGL